MGFYGFLYTIHVFTVWVFIYKISILYTNFAHFLVLFFLIMGFYIHFMSFYCTHFTSETDQIVIPLLNKSDSNNKIKLEDQNIFFKSHSFQIAFGVTFHKVQGQTVPHIILDLNKRPGRKLGALDFHGVYVGLTRVEYSDNIRLLPCRDDSDFKHLLTLKPNPNLKVWLETIPQLLE